MPYVLQSGYATVGDFVMAPGYSPFGAAPVPVPPAPRIVAASQPPAPRIVYAPPAPVMVGVVKKPGILAKIKGAFTGKPPAPRIVPAYAPPAPVIVGAKKASVLVRMKEFVTKPAVPVGPAQPVYLPPAPVIVQAPAPVVVQEAAPVLPAQPITSGPLPTATAYTGTVIGSSGTNTIAATAIATTRPTPALATQGQRPVSRAPVSFTPAVPPRGWNAAFMPGTGI